MSKTKTKPARLIVAASEQDPDMLYATKFWAPDPFIFLQRNGKRTLVLSDLEIDRGRKQADADELVMFSDVERELQGKSKKAPAYEKVLVHFLKKATKLSKLQKTHINFPCFFQMVSKIFQLSYIISPIFHRHHTKLSFSFQIGND